MSSSRRLDSVSGPTDCVVVNGWAIYTHDLFLDQYERLIIQVDQLQRSNPTTHREHNTTKLFYAVFKYIFEIIPQNPMAPSFRQGATLGQSYQHWFRAKFFQGRYRLFFRFDSRSRIIVLAWLNDENTLRAYGSKHDAYAVFRGMLARGNPPDDWQALLRAAKKASGRAKTIFGNSRGSDNKSQ